ncbi:response regulator [Mesosutterella sp. AGMB02718]|uniref:Response regulator n=1 Tax=Mesosutterella faecium TaxID=2925194 RepID=A0ABT7IKB0_9BURK|nr:response regulator [Mesosutterella sp. AGMB02718]MDL2058807.1 response regulator [Mesosutterella sp. AGMB02718]
MAKLLVVDDEVGIRELLSEILSDEGHAVQTAANAEEARQAIQSDSFNLVLLDIWMPDMDGVTLLKELSAKQLLHCPVIMMSGHATIDTAVEATRYGASDFLEKPISMKRLLTAVNAALQNSRFPGPVSAAGSAAAADKNGPHADVFRSSDRLLDTISFSLPLREARDKFEKLYLQVLLEEENYSMSKVAVKSGLERTHLYRKIKQLEVPMQPKSKG